MWSPLNSLCLYCIFISLWLPLHDRQIKTLQQNQGVQSEQSKRMGRRVLCREQEVLMQLRSKVTGWSWWWSLCAVSAGRMGCSVNRTGRWNTAPLKPDTGADGRTHTQTPHLNTHKPSHPLPLSVSLQLDQRQEGFTGQVSGEEEMGHGAACAFCQDLSSTIRREWKQSSDVNYFVYYSSYNTFV